MNLFNSSPASDSATAGVTTAVATRIPRVNLLPPEIAEAARFRRLQLAMGGAVVAAAAIVGALYVHAHSGVKTAQDELAAAQQQQATLQGQLQSLSGVQDMYTQVAAKQAMLAQAMSSEVRWSYYLTDLSMKIPDNVWLTDVSAQMGSSATPTAVGQIQFGGVAFRHNDVATWLDVLAKERGFANAYFSNSAENMIGTKKVDNFQSTADLTPDAQSHRYTTPAGS